MATLPLILASLIIVATPAVAQMKILNPLPQPNTLNSVHFVDSAYGWAAGKKATLLRTTDGGASWTISFPLPGTDHFESFSFIDRMNGWAIVGERRVVRTQDGGVTWNYLPVPESEFRTSVFFSDERHGWTTGEFGVERTTDGGSSWVRLQHGGHGILRSVFALDSLHVWGTGEDGLIIGSIDGGVTWEVQHQEGSWRSGAKSHWFNSIHFIDSVHGWAVGSLQQFSVRMRAVIFNTLDGGKTWRPQFESELGTWLQDLYDIDFEGSGHGVASGILGAILVTSDNGATWQQRHRDTNAHGYSNLHGVHFADSSNAWAVGLEGHMFRSSDGGMTWIEYSSGIPGKDFVANFYDIHFTDPLHGTVVGEYFAGVMYETEDGGITWKRREDISSTRGISSLERMLHLDANNIWIVGFDGTIIRSTDGGKSWTKKSEGLPVNFTGVAFPESGTGWAVTGNASTPYNRGLIFRTTDGGERWDSVGVSPTSLFDIYFRDADRGWIVGSPSTMLTTTDGGMNWDTTLFQGNAILYDIDFLDDRHGWIVGTHGTVIRTTDGGDTWEQRTLDPVYAVRAVEFVDENHGWAVCYNGTILYSADGGVNWTYVESHTYRRLLDLHLIDKDNGWITGERGIILRIRKAPPSSVTDHVIEEYGDRCMSSFISPNPVTGTATLRYALDERAKVMIRIHDDEGRLVRTLLNERQYPGDHMLEMDARGLSSGIYFYSITTGDHTSTSPFVICR